MPHQCTTCGHTFEDGSKEMLDGCPDCGGNTFQFHPPGSDLPEDPPADSDPPEREDPAGASAVGRAATRVRDFVAGDPGDPGDPDDSDSPGESGVSSDPGTPGDSGDPGHPGGLENPADGSPDPTEDDGVEALGTAGSDGASATGTDASGTDAAGTGPSAGSDSRAGGPSGREADRPSRSGPDRRSTGEGFRDSPEPDPNAPWPTEADDPSGSGGDRGRPSGSGDGEGDDIIDADARETERAIGDAEAAPGRSPDADRTPSDPETPSGSGGEPASSPPGSTGATPTPDDAGGARADSEAGDAPDADEGGLAAAENAPAGEGQVVSEPSDDQPDLADLREQLNEQFESIKILEPGQYELNLMELYDREEYIIALQENGRYVIQVPENWMGDRPGDG